MTRTRLLTVLASAVVVALAVGLVAGVLWWFGASRGHPTPFVKPPDVTGRTVEVTYIGSACQDGSRLELEETEREVVATVFAWQSAGSCDDVGISYTLTGTLASDLGERALVDGACRREEYRDDSDCAAG
ncbi:hypothetical protein [Oryzobacter terrae]|uniref:hypothetical protein n=1 Tax=Oryzobacter terrae TaxID=1620385 RepID=UPI0036730CF2